MFIHGLHISKATDRGGWEYSLWIQEEPHYLLREKEEGGELGDNGGRRRFEGERGAKGQGKMAENAENKR